jgi:Ran GTPase-activating protein (RanGAP) involved in mRNA processing and transport
MLNDLRLNSFDMPFVIRRALIIKQCSVLNLSNNLIDTYGIELLATALRSNLILKRLCLKGNRAQLKGVEQLMSALLINNTLEVLELETNDIPDIAANSIANMLRHNRTLKDLYLGYNYIESRGMEIIANAIDCTATLEILSVIGNKLDDTSINAVDKMIINNQKLRRLDLHENSISLEGKTRLLHIVNVKKGFKLNV